MMYKQDVLLQKINAANSSLWVIAPLGRYFGMGKTQKYLFDNYSANIVYKNLDKSIAVFKF